MLLSVVLRLYCANSSLNFHSRSLLLQLLTNWAFLQASTHLYTFPFFTHQHFASHWFSVLFCVACFLIFPFFFQFSPQNYIYLSISADSPHPPTLCFLVIISLAVIFFCSCQPVVSFSPLSHCTLFASLLFNLFGLVSPGLSLVTLSISLTVILYLKMLKIPARCWTGSKFSWV